MLSHGKTSSSGLNVLHKYSTNDFHDALELFFIPSQKYLHISLYKLWPCILYAFNNDAFMIMIISPHSGQESTQTSITMLLTYRLDPQVPRSSRRAGAGWNRHVRISGRKGTLYSQRAGQSRDLALSLQGNARFASFTGAHAVQSKQF